MTDVDAGSLLLAAAMAARELVVLRVAADIENIVDSIVRRAHVDDLANTRLAVLVRRNDVACARRVFRAAVNGALCGRAIECLERAIVRTTRRAPQVLHAECGHLPRLRPSNMRLSRVT